MKIYINKTWMAEQVHVCYMHYINWQQWNIYNVINMLYTKLITFQLKYFKKYFLVRNGAGSKWLPVHKQLGIGAAPWKT